jgi:hypothetical protein
MILPGKGLSDMRAASRRNPATSGLALLLFPLLVLAACTSEADMVRAEAEEIDRRIAEAKTDADCLWLAGEALQASIETSTLPRLESPLGPFDAEPSDPMEEDLERYKAGLRGVLEASVLYVGCLQALRSDGRITEEEFQKALRAPIEGITN